MPIRARPVGEPPQYRMNWPTLAGRLGGEWPWKDSIEMCGGVLVCESIGKRYERSKGWPFRSTANGFAPR